MGEDGYPSSGDDQVRMICFLSPAFLVVAALSSVLSYTRVELYMVSRSQGDAEHIMSMAKAGY